MSTEIEWTDLIKRNIGSSDVKADHVYAAELINVEVDNFDSKKFKFTYQVTNENAEILSINRRIRRTDIDYWLRMHTGYDKDATEPLLNISKKYHLILVSDYNGHPFVSMVKPLENMVINNEEY